MYWLLPLTLYTQGVGGVSRMLLPIEGTPALLMMNRL